MTMPDLIQFRLSINTSVCATESYLKNSIVSQSPDLAPTEHIWDELCRVLRNNRPPPKNKEFLQEKFVQSSDPNEVHVRHVTVLEEVIRDIEESANL